MLAQGFDEVYHLKGGILKYLEEVPEKRASGKGNASSSTSASPYCMGWKKASTGSAAPVAIR
jgi:hypothetical protein